MKMILAIDDEKSMLSFYKVALAEFGPVKTAQSMSFARTQLERVKLILLDGHLGEADGTMQENLTELTSVAPVLICSGIQDPMIQAIAKANGATGYWNKGTDPERLVMLAKVVLDR